VKVKTKKRQLDVGDELGVDWERWADGRAHRLKRKRHFGDVEPRLAMEAAANAAQRMGKAVQAVRDRHFPDKAIWVQFADGRIKSGSPCACGSRKLYRLHPRFLRCPQCGSTLLETATDVDEFESQPALKLRRLTGVHLARMERQGDRDVYRGFAELDGQPLLLIAEFRVEGGDRITPDEAFQRIERLDRLPLERFSDLFDVSALRGGAPDWDLVF